MEQRDRIRLLRLSAWSGFVVLVVFATCFFVLAKITPPMSPRMSPEEVVDFLVEHQSGILLAVVIMMLLIPLEYAFVVATSLQMCRIEGGWGLLSMIQLTTGVVAPVGFSYPMAILATAAYRPQERSPEVVRTLTDVFWLMYVGIAAIFVLQVVVIGLAAVLDRRSEPVFPRWFGYYNFVMGVLLAPGVAVYMFKSGPLAWDGLLAFTIPSLCYFSWKIITPIILLRAIKSEEAEIPELTTA
jgi:hypothetical protein